MKTVNYISHMLEENVEDIKALALYFDQINIIEQRHIHILAPKKNAKNVKKNSKIFIESKVISTNDYTDERFLLHLKDFEQKKIIKYLIDADSGGTSPQPGIQSISSDMQINDLVLFHSELVGKKRNKKQYTDEKGRNILSYDLDLNAEASHLTEKLFTDSDNTNKLMAYYARVFKTFVNYYERGEDVLTTSKYINDLFKEINKTDRFKETQTAFKNEFNVTPSFVLEAIKLGLPNLGKFPPEEILRFKENSKDELLEFQTKLETLTFDLLSQYDFIYINNNAQKNSGLKN